MISKKQPEDCVFDMLHYCRLAQQFVQGYTFGIFSKDAKTQAACYHALQTIGEAASRLPADFRRDHPEIPWKMIRKMRNVLVHGYDIIRWEIAWNRLTQDLPPLELKLEVLLHELTRNDRE